MDPQVSWSILRTDTLGCFPVGAYNSISFMDEKVLEQTHQVTWEDIISSVRTSHTTLRLGHITVCSEREASLVLHIAASHTGGSRFLGKPIIQFTCMYFKTEVVGSIDVCMFQLMAELGGRRQ